MPSGVAAKICSWLDRRSLILSASTCRQFQTVAFSDSVWRPLLESDFPHLYQKLAGTYPGSLYDIYRTASITSKIIERQHVGEMQQLMEVLLSTTGKLTATTENINKIQSQLQQVEQELATSRAAMANLL